MKLKAFGCSFTAGTDLDDPTQTWTSLLAQRLGFEYQSFAAPGVGNLFILHQILSEIDREPAVYIVNWSWIDRFDYTDSYDNHWQSLLPNATGAAAQHYYRHLHSQYRDKLTNLLYIQTAIQALQNKKQKFVMTCMDNLLFETEWHCDTVISNLQDQCISYINTFEGYNFLDWSRMHNFAESAQWHPLETAHQAAADYAMKNFIPALYK